MKLTAYMADANMTPGQMATLIEGVSESGVRKWMYGERVPRPDQLRRIAEVTDGKVMPNDFVMRDREEAAA